MRTYKILGLEIMAWDATKFSLEEYLKGGWRYPTSDEFDFLLQMSEELSVLGLTKGDDNYYRSKEINAGAITRKLTTDSYGQGRLFPHNRLVRDI